MRRKSARCMRESTVASTDLPLTLNLMGRGSNMGETSRALVSDDERAAHEHAAKLLPVIGRIDLVPIAGGRGGEISGAREGGQVMPAVNPWLALYGAAVVAVWACVTLVLAVRSARRIGGE